MAWKVPTHSPRVPTFMRSQSSCVDALAHLARRLVGEGDRQDAPGIGAGGHQPRDAVGDDARLARAGARDDQQRPARVQDRLALRGVELARQRLARERARDLGRPRVGLGRQRSSASAPARSGPGGDMPLRSSRSAIFRHDLGLRLVAGDVQIARLGCRCPRHRRR